MSEAHALTPSPPLTELLTWKQICERFPDQWVVLVDMDWDDETCEYTVARVAGHGATRRASLDQMREAGLVYKSIANFYTGRIDNRPMSLLALELSL